MQAIVILSAFAILGVLLSIQLKARRQIDVETPTGRRQAAAIVESYFTPEWQPVNGPGTFNYRPSRLDHAPTISITVTGSDAASRVSIWASDYDGSFHGVWHAALIWRKQHGLTKRLTSDQVPVPGFLSANSHMVSTLRTY